MASQPILPELILEDVAETVEKNINELLHKNSLEPVKILLALQRTRPDGGGDLQFVSSIEDEHMGVAINELSRFEFGRGIVEENLELRESLKMRAADFVRAMAAPETPRLSAEALEVFRMYSNAAAASDDHGDRVFAAALELVCDWHGEPRRHH